MDQDVSQLERRPEIEYGAVSLNMPAARWQVFVDHAACIRTLTHCTMVRNVVLPVSLI